MIFDFFMFCACGFVVSFAFLSIVGFISIYGLGINPMLPIVAGVFVMGSFWIWFFRSELKER